MALNSVVGSARRCAWRISVVSTTAGMVVTRRRVWYASMLSSVTRQAKLKERPPGNSAVYASTRGAKARNVYYAIGMLSRRERVRTIARKYAYSTRNAARYGTERASTRATVPRTARRGSSAVRGAMPALQHMLRRRGCPCDTGVTHGGGAVRCCCLPYDANARNAVALCGCCYSAVRVDAARQVSPVSMRVCCLLCAIRAKCCSASVVVTN